MPKGALQRVRTTVSGNTTLWQRPAFSAKWRPQISRSRQHSFFTHTHTLGARVKRAAVTNLRRRASSSCDDGHARHAHASRARGCSVWFFDDAVVVVVVCMVFILLWARWNGLVDGVAPVPPPLHSRLAVPLIMRR